jgi:hypothetical protein
VDAVFDGSHAGVNFTRASNFSAISGNEQAALIIWAGVSLSQKSWKVFSQSACYDTIDKLYQSKSTPGTIRAAVIKKY